MAMYMLMAKYSAAALKAIMESGSVCLGRKDGSAKQSHLG